MHDLYGAVAAPLPPDRNPAVPAPRSQAAKAPPRKATVETTVVPAPEPDQMIIIRGSAKKVEIFEKESGAK